MKHYSEGRPIERARLPRKVIIPLSQHIGAPAAACVSIGDEVLTGQVIGTAGGFVSAPVHSSVSGKVVGLAKYPGSGGRDVLSVFIEADGDDRWIKDPVADPGYASLDSAAIRNRITEAGIVGLGGATFPTHVKLSPPPTKKIEWLVINAAECEPYLTADHALMLEKAQETVIGISLLMKALGVEKAVVGIESNKMDAVAAMRTACQSDSRIKVEVCQVKYPQGAEKNLIRALLDREVPSGGLPMDVGVVVQNSGTAFAVYEAVVLGKPLLERVVTVTGPGIQQPRNLIVRVGTLFSDVISQCGGFRQGIQVTKVISGGPMMGIAQYSLDVPVTKGTSGILALNDDESPLRESGPCIKCGKCVEGCPMFLLPNTLSLIGEMGKVDMAMEYRVMDCVECGTCAYVCPAGRSIVHYVRHLKAELADRKRKEAEKNSKKANQ